MKRVRSLSRWLSAASLTALIVWHSPWVIAQGQPPVDRARFDAELLQHFRALLRLNTSNPPGNERLVVDYLKNVLDKEGIPTEVLSLDPSRSNLVARLKGTGAKRPLLLMGHTDVVTVDESKWTFPPFGGTRDGGYIYGRGALDDKDSVSVGLMTMLTLKRLAVPLDRDVIFLAEAGEEGTTRVGIDYVVQQHFPSIDAEYCLAEGGGVLRENGSVTYATVGVLEKIPRTIELVARGPSAHGSIPRSTNAVSRLAAAVYAISRWQPPVRLNETTREFFTRLARLSFGVEARHLQALVSADQEAVAAAVAYFQEQNPVYVSMLRTSASPTILQAGSRYNVVPSEATATIDVRLLPDEDPTDILNRIREVVNDASIEVRFAQRDGAPRPPGGTRLDTEAFRAIEASMARYYDTVTLPSMGTGASDKAQIRSKGINCYGVGPATDYEDAAKGFGSHSDQERILESELYRFGQFYWDVVVDLVKKK